MANIFLNQPLNLDVTPNEILGDGTIAVIDLNTAASAVMKSLDPDGTTANLGVATINIVETKITYQIAENILSNVGPWCFWPVITFNDGSVIPGTAIRVNVEKEGTVKT